MTVEERLSKLERINRRLLLAVSLAVSVCGVIVMTGAAGEPSKPVSKEEWLKEQVKTVMAKAVLVTEDGKSGILLTKDAIQIFDKNERRRFVLNEEGLGLYGEDEKLKANLLVQGDHVQLSLRNDGTKRQTLMFASGRTNGFAVYDKDGRSVRDLTND